MSNICHGGSNGRRCTCRPGSKVFHLCPSHGTAARKAQIEVENRLKLRYSELVELRSPLLGGLPLTPEEAAKLKRYNEELNIVCTRLYGG